MKALSIAWTLIIIALCSIPGASLPDSSLLTFDKVGHFGMFFVGVLLWLWTWPHHTGRVLAAGVALSVGTEVFQNLVPFLGRSPDVLDVVADLLGLLAGFGVLLWIQRQGHATVA